MKFIVGEEWLGWRDWSRPEGTYERLAWNILDRDKGIPEVIIQKISTLVIKLEHNAQPPAFHEDPVILRRIAPEGQITVVEGHHRIAAVCVAVASSKEIGTCVAYLAEL